MQRPGMQRPAIVESRHSRRVRFPGGNGFELAGIVDSPPESFWHQPAAAARPASPATAIAGAAAMNDCCPPVVVFSHCFTCNKDLKAGVRLGRSLAAQGVTVLRYDMTGLGGSAGSFADTNFSTNLADLRAAVRFAHDELGPVSGLLGHSFGGATTLAFAGDRLHRPSSLRGVACLAAPSETQQLARKLIRMNPQIEIDREGEVEIGGRRWQITRQMLDDFRSHNLSASIRQIDVPLLILHSPVDETVGFDHALRIMQWAMAGADEADASGGGQTDASGNHQRAVSLFALDAADHLLADNADDLRLVMELLTAFYWRYR